MKGKKRKKENVEKRKEKRYKKLEETELKKKVSEKKKGLYAVEREQP